MYTQPVRYDSAAIGATAEHSDCLQVRTAQSRSTQPLKQNGGECSTALV